LAASRPLREASTFAQAAYVNNGFDVFAGGSDHFESGYVTAELPAPALLVGGNAGESILSKNIRGYLVPLSAPSGQKPGPRL
jgi:hypothetical protein